MHLVPLRRHRAAKARFVRVAAGLFLALDPCASAAAQEAAAAQAEDLTELSLEDLMEIEVQSVRGASRRVQTTLEAPSSVSLVDSTQIERFGWRTLADILRSVGGFDVTNDRNYEHIGVRGFNPLGDYNSRVLLAIDGHRVNNSIYDTAPIGLDLPIDVALFERVEILRGPGSTLYGSNALFGVIDAVPRRGGDIDGWELEAGAGSFGGLSGRATFGREEEGGAQWVVSSSGFASDGPTLSYDEYAGTPSGGETSGRDYEQAYSLYSSWMRGDWSVQGVWGSREKGIPTGSFDTVFDADSHTVDAQGFLDAAWRPQLTPDTRLEARVAYDVYNYEGVYIYDLGPRGLATDPYLDEALGTGLSTNVMVTTTAWADHAATLGAEVRRNFDRDQLASDSFGTWVDEERQETTHGVFFDDEWRFAREWILHGGVRYDGSTDWDGKTSPRLGLIWLPDESTAWKLLFGEAFRAPNAYELYYGDGFSSKPATSLEPEEIRTFELVWERVIRGAWRGSAALYCYDIEDMIIEGVDPADGLTVFTNQESVRATGIELELERTFSGSARLRASWSLQDTRNVTLDTELTNSPEFLGKLLLDLPLGRDDLRFALEAQATGSRRTLAGSETDPFVLVHATLTAFDLADGVELALGLRNVFGTAYSDPVGSELVQDALLQDGRTFRVRLSISR